MHSSLSLFLCLLIGIGIRVVLSSDIVTVFVPYSEYMDSMKPTFTVTSYKTIIPPTITATTTLLNPKSDKENEKISFLLLKYEQDTTTITIPTNTVTLSKTLRLQAETETIRVTVNTIPITSEASLLFCYNLL